MAKKPAPKPRYYAQIDTNTGAILGYASGTNIDLGVPDGWRDITDIAGSKQLSGRVGDARLHNGVFRKKPKLKLNVSSKRVEIGQPVEVTLELVEGDPELVPDKVKIRVGKDHYELELGQKLTISSADARKINIRVNDPSVRLDDKVSSIRVVPVDTPAPVKPRAPEVNVGKARG